MTPLLTHWRTIAALFAALAMFGTGWAVRGWRCDARIASIERDAQAARDAQALRADRASMAAEIARTANDTRAYETRTTIREVYRNVEVPADCAAPVAVADSLRASVDTANAGIARQP